VRRLAGKGVLAALAVCAAGCGGDDGGGGPPVVTDQSLADSLALAAKARFEELGQFGTRVGETGGRCRGSGARWTCTLDVVIRDHIHDSRSYALTVKPDGCWTARQTGTDVGPTGDPSPPSTPDLLRGCVK
jgi:hypothetical protein